VKSVIWALKQRVLTTIRHRFNQQKRGARFIRGDLDTLEHVLSDAAAARIDFEFIAVRARANMPDTICGTTRIKLN
jgi:hypothetical protein